ncbi:MAG: TetR/AcrR family transcriptional regulator [Acidimicrobiales bacterium]|nr:TetR/AcrR family transcriptional regulator [Acidimicrobiales bacterium]
MGGETDRSTKAGDAEALDAAVAEFRQHGFVGTSVQRLVEATGRSRSSLYGRFGGKDGVFVAALERYLDTMYPIGEGETTTAQLRMSLDGLGQGDTYSPCLLVRSCAELADLPPAAQRLVTGALEKQWNAMIDSPTVQGETDKGTLALAVRHGLATLAAAGVPDDLLHNAIDALTPTRR